MADPLKIVISDDDETVHVDPDTGTVTEDQPDGSVVVRLGGKSRSDDADDDEDGWFKNLADDIDAQKLAGIANELMSAIEADDTSRQEYLETRARGFEILGIKLEKPKANVDDGADGGISRVTNPLLLEAILKGWANAQAELLPASGPCKIQIDGRESPSANELAEALQRGLNHYLTVTAPEFYPDTSHMLLWGTYYGGSGFKKAYRCPMRRRPVSESVDVKDLIVSDTTKDVASCARITHQIPMRPSVMKRMQLLGVYRDAALTQPTSHPNVVDEKIAGIQGTDAKPRRPEDQPYTIWESQCELDIEQFAPGKFRGEGIPLPYLVTIDKDSREILSITRDWEEDDEECQRQQMYVRYPYVPGPGFYGTGMLNIIGNASAAMTGAWREALDAGMLANFPGGLIAKLGGRQNSQTFRLSPGQFEPVETNGLPINQIIMGLPYKDVTPGLLSLIDKITEQAKSLGTSAEVPAGEGLANIPVGTMLAQIEQATKIMAAAHKGMHTAMGEEIRLLLKLFRRNPEDFWVNNRECSPDYWSEQKLIQAIDTCELVPVSDPNIPSHVHRVMKAVGLVQLSGMPQFTPRLDMDEVLRRVLTAIREEPIGLIVQPPPQAQVSPEDQAKMLTAQAKMQDSQAKVGKIQMDQQTQQGQAAVKQWEIQGDIQGKNLDIQKELIIHNADMQKIAAGERKDQMAIAAKGNLEGQDQQLQREKHGLELVKAGTDMQLEKSKQDADMVKHTREHGLALSQADWDKQHDIMQHNLEATKAAHETAISAHEAFKPAAPAKKRAAGGAVEDDAPLAGLGAEPGFVMPHSDSTADAMREFMGPLAKAMENLAGSLRAQERAYTKMTRTLAAPKRVLRNQDGKMEGVEIVPPGEDPEPINVVVDKT